MAKSISSAGSLLSSVFEEEVRKWGPLKSRIIEIDDAEAIHDLRVSIRRIRTLVKLLGTSVSPELTQKDLQLRRLFHLLGDLRSHDQALDAVSDFKKLPKLEVAHHLKLRRVELRKRAVETLQLPNVLDDLADLGPMSLSNFRAKPVIQHVHKQSLTSLKRITLNWEISEVHRFRRRVKRLRYTVEFFGPLYGKDADRYTKTLVHLQDRLGEFMDWVSIAEILAHLDGLSPEAARACLRYIERLNRRAMKQKKPFMRSKKVLSGKAWKRLN